MFTRLLQRYRWLSLLLCAALVLSTTSCSFAGGSTQSIMIQASDPAAEIYVDGGYVGKGTANVSLAKKRAHSVMAKVGDRVGIARVDKSISTLGVLDIIGGVLFLVPLIGIFAPGFWELEPDTVYVAIPSQ